MSSRKEIDFNIHMLLERSRYTAFEQALARRFDERSAYISRAGGGTANTMEVTVSCWNGHQDKVIAIAERHGAEVDFCQSIDVRSWTEVFPGF